MKDRPCPCTAWYLIHCQSRKEKYASHVLESQLGLSTFLPEYKIHARGEEIRTRPFFPGYLFAQANLQQVPLSQINATPGVIRLVAFGDEPQSIPLDVIDVITERLRHFERAHFHPFQPGDTVRVKQGGPLQDLEMIFVGSSSSSRRVTVLLNLLGRLKEVHLDIELLEKISSHDPVREKRYLDQKGFTTARSA